MTETVSSELFNGELFNGELFNGSLNRLTSFMNAYYSCLKSTDAMVGECIELNRKLIRGEEVSAEGLTGALKQTYRDSANCAMALVEDTPFKAFIPPLPKEVPAPFAQKNGKGVLQETLNFYAGTIKVLRFSQEESKDICMRIVKEKTLTPDIRYERTTEAWMEMMKSLLEGIPSRIFLKEEGTSAKSAEAGGKSKGSAAKKKKSSPEPETAEAPAD